MVSTDNGRYIWVANRATNNIAVLDTLDWANENARTYINDVGNKPNHIVLNHSKTKLFVANDDSNGQTEPDFVTVIDVATKTIDGYIYVADRPMSVQVDATDQYVYVACKEGRAIQKASVATRKVVATKELEGEPEHIKFVDNKLYVTCFDTDELYCLNPSDLSILTRTNTDNGPSQMEAVNGKLYVVCQGADDVMIFDIATNTLENRIEVGSRPNPIAYNAPKNLIYVGNSGEGSVCIISPTTNAVVEWCMTGDNPAYILVTEDGEKWYVSAHGPEDIVYYGKDTPYTGDAYVDNGSVTHKYGAEYWMPSRSKWVRGVDNTLTSFSSVEFWPEERLAGKEGYAH
jgi:YVTN family beta-propeller protein